MGVFGPRIEVIVQMQNKQKIGAGGGGGWSHVGGVKVDVNQELFKTNHMILF